MTLQESIILSTDDWELFVGEQLRALRIRASLDQIGLADRAGISLGAIKNLECGRGSTLKTLIKALRALDAQDWLKAIAPVVEVSPMQMLLTSQKNKPRSKVFRHRASRQPKVPAEIERVLG